MQLPRFQRRELGLQVPRPVLLTNSLPRASLGLAGWVLRVGGMGWVSGTVHARCGVSGEQANQLEEGVLLPAALLSANIYTTSEGGEGGGTPPFLAAPTAGRQQRKRLPDLAERAPVLA